MHEFKTDSLLVRYLLGEASPEERSDLEAKYLANADLFEEVIATENDLIDAYAGGQLRDSDRKRFEEYFLGTPERQQRVEFAKALRNHVAEECKIQEKAELLKFSPPQPRWPALVQLGILSLFLAIVIWSIWMTARNFHLRNENARLQAQITDLLEKNKELQQQMEAYQKDTLKSEGDEQQQAKATPAIAVFTLHAGISRGNSMSNRVIISAETQSVCLQLVMEDHHYSKLDASIETVNGDKIWHKKDLPVRTGRKPRVDLTLPAKILTDDDYIANLTRAGSDGNAEMIGSYAFRVIRH
jgi:anti-sigma factor RsiW